MGLTVFRVLKIDSKMANGWGSVKIHGKCQPLEQPVGDIDDIAIFPNWRLQDEVYWRDTIWQIYDCKIDQWLILGPIPDNRREKAMSEFKRLFG